MFYHIKGTLELTEGSFAVVDCGGVGFRLTVSDTTKGLLPERGAQVKLYTYMSVREDAMELFGFSSQEELSSFRMLISVSGVGPKAAMSVLSQLPPEKFALAVINEDSKALSRAQGVGAKTAARIVLELHDKLARDFVAADAPGAQRSAQGVKKGALSEAADALLVLGYTRSEALAALRDADPNDELEAVIKAALAKLMK